jgi:histidine kinase
MKLIKAMRRQLALKLFLSYVLVIVTGVLVLAATTDFIAPTAFERHFTHMEQMMPGMGMFTVEEGGELYSRFRGGVDYAIGLAIMVTLVAALAVSWFVSRRMSKPVGEMAAASQRIAEGDYHSRVHIPGSMEPDEMDEFAILALRFNQMAQRLDQIETLRSQLIGDIAHELRTPLSTIKGSMEGLMDRVLPDNEETFMRVYHEADRLQRLVNDLQELSRVEVNSLPLDCKPIRINVLIEAVTERLKGQFEDKSVSLAVELDPSLPAVEIDADRIQQVLINLVGNALQYTPEAGSVKVTAHSRATEIVTAIEDNGIGIPLEDIPHIFTRFYRVEKSRSRAGGGSGIGLTIAKHLVEAHSGRIWAESAGPGRGSTFMFTIPIRSLQKL